MKAKKAARPAGSSQPARLRVPPARCDECGGRDELQQFDTAPLVASRRSFEPKEIRLCAMCVRDRSASWRWRVKITGRALPEQEDRAA